MINVKTSDACDNNVWYRLVIIYLLFDYARLHDTFHIAFARPLMVITILLIVMIIKSRQLFKLKNNQLKLIWLFILLLALYIPFAHNNFRAYKATSAMLLYMPFIISITICVNSMERLKNFLFINILIMAYISLYAITHSGHGPGNYFFDENDLALYINCWIPICYFLFWGEQNGFKKLLYASSLVLGLLAIVVSFSRGGFVGLVAAFFAIWLFSPRKIISMVIVAIMVLLVFLFSDPAYRAEMNSVTDTKESTATNRLESWKSGWEMFLDNPLGVGGNNFPVRFPEYQTDFFKRGMWGTVAHSLWFTLIPELGIGGIVIYFLLLFYNMRDIFFLKNVHSRNENKDISYLNNLGRAFIGTLAGFFASATFISVLYYAHYWYLTGLFVATVNIAHQMKATEDAGIT